RNGALPGFVGAGPQLTQPEPHASMGGVDPATAGADMNTHLVLRGSGLAGARRFSTVCGLFVIACMGCAKVEPGADFQRASELISERTGSNLVYTPQHEAIVEELVQGLLT